MTLKDKVELYEYVLKRIAEIDVEKECNEALENSHNPGKVSTSFIDKYPFAFGMMRQAFKFTVFKAKNALEEGKK